MNTLAPFVLRISLLAALVLAPTGARVCVAQAPLGNAHTANAPVYSMFRDGNRIYVGGDLGVVGPAYGGAVATRAETGDLAGFPEVAGTVRAIASDGAGGWYLGGSFVFVRGVPRVNLAHIDAGHNVTAWAPVVSGTVTSLLVSDSALYFVTAIPAGNSALFKADRGSASVTQLLETTNGAILSMALAGGRLFVGGEFRFLLRDTTYVESPGAAALDPETGALLDGWSPGSDPEQAHTVESIAANDSLVFVGGYFNIFGGQSTYCIAALDAATGNAIPWHVEDPGTFRIRALALRDSTLFVGGGFSQLGSQNRLRLAALDIRTGLARAWNPGVSGECALLSISGSTLFAAGQFAPAAFDVETGAARDWHPPSSISDYLTIAAADSIVYVGAGLNTIGASIRNRVAVLDATTGTVTPWSADAEGSVEAFATAGPLVYVGGTFRRINGLDRNRVAALDSTTGEPNAWNPGADNDVEAIAVSGNTVYLGGSFTQVQGQPRNRLAAVDATTGALLPWDPGADATVHTLATAGGVVYAGGNFTMAGGQPRSKLAAIDSATGLCTAFDPSPNNDVYRLIVRGGSLYLSGRFSRIGDIKRGRMAAIDLATGAPLAFDPKANGPVRSFTFSGSTIYLGGEFDLIGSASRSRIAAVDAVTGIPRSWDPELNGTIRAMAYGANIVFAGGDFVFNGNLPRSYLAVVPDEQTTATLVTQFQIETTRDAIVIRWQLGGVSGSSWCDVERAESDNGPWSPIGGRIERERTAGSVIDRDIQPGVRYWYRLVIHDADQTWATSPLEATAFEPVSRLALGSISPTPSRGPVTIDFDLPGDADVALTLLDVQGRVAGRIANDHRSAGRHRIAWNGEGAEGRLESGVYFIRLDATGRSVFRRCVFVR